MDMYRLQFLSFFFIITTVSCTKQTVINENEKSAPIEIEAEEKFVLPKIPDTVVFAGTEILINNFDLKERLDKEIVVNTFYHSSTIQSFKRAARYFPFIEGILKKNGIPTDFKYLCLIESGLTQATSPSDAKGFWQFIPETAKKHGLIINKEIDERMHIEKSTHAACDYLKQANGKFNDWTLAAAAYNRGTAGIESDLAYQGVTNYSDLHLNEETSRYVFRILAMKLIFENPEEYGFYPSELELYEPIDTKAIKVNETIPDLALWAKQNGSNYRMLKLLNPWILTNRLTIAGQQFELLLPNE